MKMMHILAATIFLGALALSMAVIGRMIAANRGKILTALAGHPVANAASAEIVALRPELSYARRIQRFRVDSSPVEVPVTLRLAA